MKRNFSALLLIVMLAVITAFTTACERQTENMETDSERTTSYVGETESQETETETEQIKPNLPDTTYNGQSLRFLSREVTDGFVRYYSEISAFEMNSEVMNDAIFERTQRMESTWDIKIVDETAGDVSGMYSKCYQAGEQNWDVIVPSFQNALSLAQKGYNADWKTIPIIDLEKPWWDGSAAKSMEIGGNLYSVIGAMNTWTDSHTYAVIFNKELAANLQISPYDMVQSNVWTLDRFSAILEETGDDIDGNGEIDDADRFGAVGEYFNFQLFMLASDVILICADENGYPQLNITEKFYDGAEKICAMLTGDDYMLAENYNSKYTDPWTDALRANFRAGKSLFYTGGVENLMLFRDLEIDIGLLPMPKYEETQENYRHSFNTYWSSIMVIPRNSETMDFTGHMLEAMNADSYSSTSVAYYDVILSGMAMRDEDSCEMLDIIRSSRTIDPEMAYGFLDIAGVYANMLKAQSTDSLASSVESAVSKAGAKIERFIAKYQE